MRDFDRIDRITAALRESSLDAIVCTRPSNVLLLSGYWPVIGTSIAVATRDGAVGLAAPDDEEDLVITGSSDARVTFTLGSLDSLPPLLDVITPAFAALLRQLGVTRGRIGWERGPMLEPSSYVGTNRYGAALGTLLSDLCPAAELTGADELLSGVRAVLTPRELTRLRLACRIVDDAFRRGASSVNLGATERAIAAAFSAPLGGDGIEDDERTSPVRAGGSAYCMSGPNAALAGRAYARTRDRRIQSGDLIMVHCNSFADGFWTDVTRTFHVGPPDRQTRRLFDVVLAAQQAAFDAIEPGVPAREVDRAARAVLVSHGLGDACPHGIGHGVGFAAIDHLARPRIHPASDDVLEVGMVFNVEPAVYLEGQGGVRQCSMVEVVPRGAEILTPFQSALSDLVRTP